MTIGPLLKSNSRTGISKKFTKTAIGLAALGLTGCSAVKQPAYTQAQADSYNDCMKDHWSSLADTMLFGVAGYMYEQNVETKCQQYAFTTAPMTMVPATVAVDSDVK
jgi:hypothetical protein